MASIALGVLGVGSSELGVIARGRCLRMGSVASFEAAPVGVGSAAGVGTAVRLGQKSQKALYREHHLL
ncbi:hypothetical protein [Candidatus Poriferisocius sp.]|uniref:hypothetical protein n=1 Tax=Candidatus Poriferisocius sp. TaxID=3101276 RepID=UPI003B013DE7